VEESGLGLGLGKSRLGLFKVPLKYPRIYGLCINVSLLVGGLEDEFYDFPYIGNNHPN